MIWSGSPRSWAQDGPRVAAEAEIVPLFDGTSLDRWTTLAGEPVTEGWQIEEGVLHRAAWGGSLVTREEFDEFELEFEWRLAAGANSGLKYRVRRYAEGRWLGCEYQLLNRAGSERPSPETDLGALYGLFAAERPAESRPAPEFNVSRVVHRAGRVEHWLNGEPLLAVAIGDAEWQARVAASKFNDVPEFAVRPRGHILLQDHHGEAWFRRITLLRRPDPPGDSAP